MSTHPPRLYFPFEYYRFIAHRLGRAQHPETPAADPGAAASTCLANSTMIQGHQSAALHARTATQQYGIRDTPCGMHSVASNKAAADTYVIWQGHIS